MLWLSGQAGMDLRGALVSDDITAQTEKTFENLAAVLEGSGASLDDVVRVGVFLSDLGDFQAMNAVYEKWFTEPYPARTTVQAGLAVGMKVEIDVMAILGSHDA